MGEFSPTPEHYFGKFVYHHVKIFQKKKKKKSLGHIMKYKLV